MACVILQGPDGVVREIPMGTTYRKRPGEKILGANMNCGPQADNSRPNDERKQLLRELDEKIGHGAGDWIKRFAAPVAKILGKAGCSSCETRRIVTNAYARLKAKQGQAKALQIMAELWKESFSKPDEEILKALQSYLE